MPMTRLFTACVAQFHTARMRRIATRELAAMSAHELGDMGITRLDVSRLFEPRLVPEFRPRGGGRVASVELLPQRSAVMTSLEAPV